MTAPVRRKDAAHAPAADVWREASLIRREWLEHGLSTVPADRETAQRSVTAIYARMSRPRPRFEWVDSPAKALAPVDGWPTLDDLYRWIRDPRGRPSLASDLATVASRLRAALSAGVAYADPELSPARKPGKAKEPWPELAPLDALARGVPLPVVLHQSIRGALHRSLGKGFRQPVRAALGPDAPVCWYGQQDACWIGYYDTLRRLDLADWSPGTIDHFGVWADLARSTGWWWPGEQVCVLVDRPARVRVEPVPHGRHEEVALTSVAYRDGWQPF
ncbi:hypothetical protein Ais01nite_48820 [Asanoa ishikariensis]|uniref:DUF6745 domain-containing protein n=1 Tax=Asanoa ishikariensis TaxID=137265 RepID=A0A1H3RVR8_9ACTN|nr:hypothetical protein [Asanoa ishikariensis]GIF66847.1 hypothetical protein Ais01nite_48820 [Asanoa ishikariensis]SDZ28959.1 hypothetical protein SAMN05421684_4198 [Asanoa ishikariensis]